MRLPADHPDRMPRDGDPLTADEISLLARWIAQGAKYEKAGDRATKEAIEEKARKISPFVALTEKTEGA